jgi:hypothetical protein
MDRVGTCADNAAMESFLACRRRRMTSQHAVNACATPWPFETLLSAAQAA